MSKRWNTIHQGSGSQIAGQVAGTYALANGNAAAVGSTGTLYPQAVVYLDPADFSPKNGKRAKLRVRSEVHVNNVTPTGNITVGLYPITRPASSGGTGVLIYDIGSTPVTGSTKLYTAPAADDSLAGVSSEFNAPAAGFYVLAIVTTATFATSSLAHVNAKLQVSND